MRKLLLPALSSLFLLLFLLLLAHPATAVPLDVVEVSAPDINCVFDTDCRITVSDSTAPITLPAASGEGFLQSRTAPPGEAGTPGQGLTPYEYRIDLRQIGGLTALPCITQLSLDFGPHQALDYDGDGNADDVFVVTGGGLGSVGLASADRVGDRITFRFAPAVCAGNRPGAGESTFFFGLAGSGPPQAVTAEAVVTLGGPLTLAARAPGGHGGGGGGGGGSGPGPGPGLTVDPCFPGLPISADVPVCRCLRDRVLRELRCALLDPDFVLVRRTPLPIPPGGIFNVQWTFMPLGGFTGTVVVEEGLAPGFERPDAPAPLKFEGRGQGRGVSQQYRLVAPQRGGSLDGQIPSLVTVTPRGGQAKLRSFPLVLPLGPGFWQDLGDVPSEPIPRPPAHPDFGDGPCGRAAQWLWDEHVARFGETPFGLSLAEYTDLKERAERCRRALPGFGGLCAGSARSAWAACFLSRGRSCITAAEEAREACLRFIVDPMIDRP